MIFFCPERLGDRSLRTAALEGAGVENGQANSDQNCVRVRLFRKRKPLAGRGTKEHH